MAALSLEIPSAFSLEKQIYLPVSEHCPDFMLGHSETIIRRCIDRLAHIDQHKGMHITHAVFV